MRCAWCSSEAVTVLEVEPGHFVKRPDPRLNGEYINHFTKKAITAPACEQHRSVAGEKWVDQRKKKAKSDQMSFFEAEALGPESAITGI